LNEKRLFTRRKFLIGSAATLGGVVLAWTQRLLGIPAARAQEPDLTPQVYLPIVTRSEEPAKPCVVHVRDADATDWNGTDPFYNAVDQAVVNSMVQTGLQILTGQESWAWPSSLAWWQRASSPAMSRSTIRSGPSPPT
jgi:hypothetical protein